MPVSEKPRAGILITGTEVLSGIISDRNGPWLSERLREIGVDPAMIEIVGDRPSDLLAALQYMAREGMAPGSMSESDLLAEVQASSSQADAVAADR